MDNKFILLVEDNPDDELLAKRALKKNSISSELVVVRDGQEAIEYLFSEGQYDGRDASVLPYVIFLDLKLPKLDGIDVLKRIRADGRTSMIPVVVLTSSNEESDIINCYKYGANSFICKPVDFEQFVEASRQMGAYWLSLNITPVGLN
ncbi:MAG: response regulator [Gammaproteobacteria bacterium]|nr:response regulator [Gammaproteobacteria bacterium]